MRTEIAQIDVHILLDYRCQHHESMTMEVTRKPRSWRPRVGLHVRSPVTSPFADITLST